MNKEIGIHHGALCETYEQQVNKQGYTLGDKAELMQKIGFGLTISHIHGIITDSMYDKALQKLQKYIVQNLQKVEQ